MGYTACAGVGVDPLGVFGVIFARTLLDEGRCAVLLLAHLLLLHVGAGFLFGIALPQASLSQIASQVNFHGGTFHEGFTFFGGDVVLD